MSIAKRIPGLIQVLWIEDDPKVTLAYPLEAEDYDIQLVSFSCWDEAKIALRSQFRRWEAIILDAKCKVHPESHDNAVMFLGNVFPELISICNMENRMIPWYVLSGGSETEIADSIPELREKWDGDWDKKYYSKSTDRTILFERIQKYARRAPAMDIQQRYQNVFTAIEACGIGHDCYSMMEELLCAIHYSAKNIDYNKKFGDVRNIIEAIFRHMMLAGFLPEQDKVKFEWCWNILCGKEVRDKEKTKIAEGKERILPIIIGDNIIEMRHVVGAYVHTESGSEKNTKNTISYLKSVHNTTYLLQSYALQLCDIILWYAFYYLDHNDKEINVLNWEVYDKIKFGSK